MDAKAEPKKVQLPLPYFWRNETK